MTLAPGTRTSRNLDSEGRHFVAVQDEASDPLRRDAIHVVMNWFGELRTKTNR